MIDDRLVNERGGVSSEMALRLAKVFGSTSETWLRLQMAFDLAEVRKSKADQIDAVRPLGIQNEPA